MTLEASLGELDEVKFVENKSNLELQVFRAPRNFESEVTTKCTVELLDMQT